MRFPNKLFRSEWMVLCIAVALFVVPFFWFKNGEADFGGDASRLYFYDALNSLRNVGAHTVATFDVPSIHMLPFFALLALLQVVFRNPSVLLSLVNGWLFSFSFLSVYLVLRVLQEEDDCSEGDAGSILGGLFYALSGIFVYSWQRYLQSFHAIVVYPFVIWLFLLFLKSGRKRYLLYAILLTVPFAHLFSWSNSPGFFSFFPLASIVLVWYAWRRSKVVLLLKGMAFLMILTSLIQAFHLLPQVANIMQPSSGVRQLIFSDAGKLERGLNYFTANAPYVRLVYNLLGFPQYYLYQTIGAPPAIVDAIEHYSIRYIGLFFMIPLTVCLASMVVFIRRRQGIKDSRHAVFIGWLSIFLIMTFFMTANLFGSWGPSFYRSLFWIPGFSMFRSFYGAFSNAFIFFYALLFGFSCAIVFRELRSRVILYGYILLLVVPLFYGAFPLFAGKVANIELDGAVHMKASLKLKPAYGQVLQWLRETPLDTTLLLLPLVNFDYQVIEGERGGAYVGAPSIPFLTGRSTYAGLGTFEFNKSKVASYNAIAQKIEQRDYRSLQRLFSFLHIGFIFHNASPEVYDNFFGFPYSPVLKKLFPTAADVQTFVNALGYTKVFSAGPYSIFYDAELFVPQLFIPRTIIKVSAPEEIATVISSQDSYDPATAFYQTGGSPAKQIDVIPGGVFNGPALEFKKITSTKYRIRAHKMTSSFPLVFGDYFNDGWRLYPQTVKRPSCQLFNKNDITFFGVSNEEENIWCHEGIISTSGQAFISQPYAGSIQNQNLPAGTIFETWFQRPLSASAHLKVNDYANSWWVDLEQLRRDFPDRVWQNINGSYEVEFILEFIPQRYFYIGTAVSLLTFFGIVGYSISVWVRRKRLPYETNHK